MSYGPNMTELPFPDPPLGDLVAGLRCAVGLVQGVADTPTMCRRPSLRSFGSAAPHESRSGSTLLEAQPGVLRSIRRACSRTGPQRARRMDERPRRAIGFAAEGSCSRLAGSHGPDRPDDRGRWEIDECSDDSDQDRCERCPHQRDEVEQPDEPASGTRKGTPRISITR